MKQKIDLNSHRTFGTILAVDHKIESRKKLRLPRAKGSRIAERCKGQEGKLTLLNREG